MIGVVELYRWVVPFHAENPMYHEVTINEPVIGNWRYGGQDEEGYLRFYEPNGSSVVIPPNAHTLDLNGKFVVIEHYTPSSFTFAQPFEAVPPKWLIIGFGVIVVIASLLMIRMNMQPKRMRAVKPPRRIIFLDFSQIRSNAPKKSQRFRPRR